MVECEVEEAPLGPPVTLAELSVNWQNFTEAGYSIYAESIKGRQFIASARGFEIKADTSGKDTYTASLGTDQFGNVVIITIAGIPVDAAGTYKEGTNYSANGVITHSNLDGSQCRLSLQYLATDS